MSAAGSLGAVDVGNAFSEIEGGILGGGDVFELEEGYEGVLEVLAALVAEVTSADVKTK